MTSWLDLQNFLMEFYQVYEKSCPQHVSQFFIYVKRPSIFVERIYQLKNFDMNVKGFHLGCPLLSTKSIYFYEIYNTISKFGLGHSPVNSCNYYMNLK